MAWPDTAMAAPDAEITDTDTDPTEASPPADSGETPATSAEVEREPAPETDVERAEPVAPDFGAKTPASEPHDPFADGGGTERPVPPRVEAGLDPRQLRIGAFVMFGTAAVAAVGGTVTALLFGIRGRAIADERQRDNKQHDELCLTTPSQLSAFECEGLKSNIEVARSNGQRANLAVGLGVGIGLSIAVLGVGGGVGMLLLSRSRAATHRAARLKVSPMATRTFAGGSLSARF